MQFLPFSKYLLFFNSSKELWDLKPGTLKILYFPKGPTVTYCKLSAGCIYIFTAVFSKPHIYPVFFEVLHKAIGCFFSWFRKLKGINRIVFNNIHQVRRHLPVNF